MDKQNEHLGDDADTAAGSADEPKAGRRRRIGLIVAAVLVTVVAIGAAATAALRQPPALRQPSAQPQPSAQRPGLVGTTAPSTPPPPAPLITLTPGTGSVSSASIGLDVLSGNNIYTSDNRRIALSLPRGYTAAAATRVPDGWVVEASYTDGQGLFFQPERGQLVRIGTTYAINHAVSADGRTVVVRGNVGVLTAYELPSVTAGRTIQFPPEEDGPQVKAVSGDFALISSGHYPGKPTTGYAWNFRTGDLIATDLPVTVFGMSGQGQVLRRTLPGGAGQACFDLVPVAQLGPVRLNGLCTTEVTGDELPGRISPDGTWVMLIPSWQRTDGTAFVVARTADLNGRRWQPVTLLLNEVAWDYYWDTDRTFIAVTTSWRYQRCDVDSGCVPVTMPAGLTEPKLVARHGIGPR